MGNHFATGDAEVTCTNNAVPDAAAFSAPDVTGCVKQQCFNADASSLGFPNTDVLATAELACKDYDKNFAKKGSSDGLAKLACTINATTGAAEWSNSLDITSCVD